MQRRRALLSSMTTACLFLAPSAEAYASWFVDRRLSCLTDLAPNEIIMNNEVKSHAASREPSIRLEVSPLGDDRAAPHAEYAVTIVVPAEARARVPDLQFVIDLSSGPGEGPRDPPARFSEEPPGGGIGCDGHRSNGKLGNGSSAGRFTINGDAARGARLEINAGWAIGHEAVTLTEKVVVFVGQGVEGQTRGGGGAGGGNEHKDDDDHHADDHEEFDDDDALQDDMAEAELEELLLEEEREDLRGDIDAAEEEAVEALEEKRRETGGHHGDADIDAMEERVVDALEKEGWDANEALDAVRDAIVRKQKQKLAQQEHAKQHRGDKVVEAQKKRAAKEKLEAMHRGFLNADADENTADKLDVMMRRLHKRRDSVKKVEELRDMKGALKDEFAKLHDMDAQELQKARHRHIKPPPRKEVQRALKELKQRAQQKIKEGVHKLSDTLGVNELMNDPRLKEVRGKMQRGLRGEGNGAHHGDVGRPLPPEGRHFLFVMFSLFGLAGMASWCSDQRRQRAMRRKRRQ